MIDLGFLQQLITGAWLTLQLAATALVIGLVIGLAFALIQLSAFKKLAKLSYGFMGIIRGLPELLVLFFVYFGGTIILTRALGEYTNVNAFWAGVCALALIFASYASEAFRGAFYAINKGELEAARSFGFSPSMRFLRIILPQFIHYVLPSLGNLWFVLLKDTALVSLIGLSDLMSSAQLAASSTNKPFTYYLAAGIIYLIFTSLSLVLIKQLEKKYHILKGSQP